MKKNILIAVITLLLVCTSCAVRNAAAPTRASDTASSQVAIVSSPTSAAPAVSSQPAVSSASAVSSKTPSAAAAKKPSAASTAKKAQSAPASSKSSEIFPMGKVTYNNASSEKVIEKPLTYTCYPPDPITDDEFTHMLNSGNILISTSNRVKYVFKPKDQQATRAKIVGWLKQSTPYTMGIPDDVKLSFPVMDAPDNPFMSIHIPDLEDMTICPVFYYNIFQDGNGKEVGYCRKSMKNVLRININEKTGYITSSELYNWLVNENTGFESDCNKTNT